MDGSASCRGGRRFPGERDGLSNGDGGPWKIPAAVSRVRDAGSTNSLRGQRDELLPDLPDGRKAAGGPGAIADPEGRLAEELRRVGNANRAEKRRTADGGRKRRR